MKICTLITLLAFLTFAAYSQSPLKSLHFDSPKQLSLNQSKSSLQKQYFEHCKSQTERGASYWVCYALDNDSLNGNIATLSGNYLFPDSNVFVNFDDGTGGTVEGTPYIHELGDVMDPISFVFQYIDGVPYTTSDPYYVDSAGVVLAYYRNTDESVVDTMMVYMYCGPVSNTGNLPTYYYADNSSSTYWYDNYGYDTIRLSFMKYAYATNKPTASGTKTIKVPLYESDSSSFFYFKFFSTNNFYVPAGQKTAMAVTFKPGYSYEPFDNITDVGNYMIFSSYQENGDGTFQTYIPQERNVSTTIPTQIRYNQDPNGYNGLFIPSYAYIDPYPWQRHLFLYHLSDEAVGIDEASQSFSNVMIAPNPSKSVAKIYFDLQENADVTIKVTDVAGKIMTVLPEGYLVKGDHNATLDLSSLSSGIYFVTIQSGNETATQKLVVGR